MKIRFQAFALLYCIWFLVCVQCFTPFQSPIGNGYKGDCLHRASSLYESENIDTGSIKSFKELLPGWLWENCKKLGFTEPTEVQAVAIPMILDGKDTVVQAQTGSGKTLVYSLPILAKVDASRASIQAVIVVPTRELGLQVAAVLKQLSHGSPEKILVMTVIEGSNNRRQQIWASAEPPHIVVGNPSALQRLVDNGRLRLNAVNFVVVDEVDACLLKPKSHLELHRLLSRHLSNTFQEIESDDEESVESTRETRVFRNIGKQDRDVEQFRGKRQAIMCSATIPQRKYFAESCFRNGWMETLPELINISKDKLLPENINHEIVPCLIEQRLPLTSFLLRAEAKVNPDGQLSPTIIFVDYEDAIDRYADFITKSLRKSNLLGEDEDISILTSEMSIEDRRSSLEAFRLGKVKVLLCTDLAARGIDIPTTSLVIQMALPPKPEDYLHRSGRTGRLGRPGKVITLMQEEEEFVVKRYSNEMDIVMRRRILQVK